MFWLVAASFGVNLAALAAAAALVRAGRAPAWMTKVVFATGATSLAAALWSVYVVREGFGASALAAASEKAVVLASHMRRALDFALASLVLAAVTLLVLAAIAFWRSPRPGRATTSS